MWTYVVQAGMIGYILVGISILSIGVVFDRVLFWLFRGRGLKQAECAEVLDAFAKGEYHRARVQTEARRSSPEVRGLGILLEHLGAPDDAPLDIALSREQREAGRWLMILEVNGAVAPMLGILGTVVGIIQSFQGMRNSSTPDTAVMVSGLSLSMLTTAIGLIVALLSIVPYNILAAKAHRTQTHLAEFLQECWMLVKKNRVAATEKPPATAGAQTAARPTPAETSEAPAATVEVAS